MAYPLVLLAVAKTQPGAYQALVDDFAGRIARYAPFQLDIIPEAKGMSDPVKATEREGQALLLRLKPTDFLVLLDEKGTQLTSVQMAKHLQQWLEQPQGRVVFALGGAHGYSAEVYQRARFQLALGPMTLPHQLARVVFLEQLYRSFTILKNESYHHA
jgi:23S rRNA (pseudouridine1915-N3)-methyltransferase